MGHFPKNSQRLETTQWPIYEGLVKNNKVSAIQQSTVQPRTFYINMETSPECIDK